MEFIFYSFLCNVSMIASVALFSAFFLTLVPIHPLVHFRPSAFICWCFSLCSLFSRLGFMLCLCVLFHVVFLCSLFCPSVPCLFLSVLCLVSLSLSLFSEYALLLSREWNLLYLLTFFVFAECWSFSL